MQQVQTTFTTVFGLLALLVDNGIHTNVYAQAGSDWPDLSLESQPGTFTRPLHITHAGDGSGRLFVVEQDGYIRILKDGAVLGTPFLDIHTKVSCCGEQGLLSVAFPPHYATKGYFYVAYTNGAGDTIVARYSLTADPDIADPNSEEVIVTVDQPFTNHNGGQLTFGPDGYLYIGMGDGGSAGDPQNNAQNRLSLLGKLLRIDVESGPVPYANPPTNPFIHDTRYRPEIWALGFRNPWRYAFDRQTGDLYIGDVGQGKYEEIDFQPASSLGGENYGWRCKEGKHKYDMSGSCPSLKLTAPLVEYSHIQGGCSVTGGMVYRGVQSPRLRGIYLYADFCSGKIWGLQRDSASRQSTLLLDTPYLISTFGEDEAGEVYVADYGAGKIYKLSDTLPPTNVDLTGGWRTLTQTCRPRRSGELCRLDGTLLVRNQGSERMARSVIISFYLSPDSTFDSVDTLLEQITLSPLPGGKETKKKFAATLPVGTRASGQFIIGMIDATNRIAEIDETGNTTVFGPVP